MRRLAIMARRQSEAMRRRGYAASRLSAKNDVPSHYHSGPRLQKVGSSARKNRTVGKSARRDLDGVNLPPWLEQGN